MGFLHLTLGAAQIIFVDVLEFLIIICVASYLFHSPGFYNLLYTDPVFPVKLLSMQEFFVLCFGPLNVRDLFFFHLFNI